MNARLPVILCLAAAHAAAQGPLFQLKEREVFTPSAAGNAVLPIDGDGDGRTDLLGIGPAGAMFYRQVGPMRFQGTPGPVVAFGQTPAIGDFDRDGDFDFATGQTVYQNNGSGAFVLNPVGLPTQAFGLLVPRLGAGDFDGDGDLDLLAAGNRLWVLTNDGTGVFQDTTAAALQGAEAGFSDFVITDVDFDGDPDFVGMRSNVDKPWLFRNDGAGHFTPSLIAAASLVFGVFGDLYAVDLDGDSIQDLVIGSAGLPLQLLRNDGTGHFTPIAAQGLPTLAHWLPWADLDQDGRADLVRSDGYWRHNGDYVFTREPFPAHPSAAAPQLADLDGDLDLDIVFAGQTLVVLQNTQRGFVRSTSHGVPMAMDIAPFAEVRYTEGLVQTTTLVGRTGLIDDQTLRPYDFTDRAYRFLPFPGAETWSDAALFTAGSGAMSVALCTPVGLRFYEVAGDNLVVPASQPSVPSAEHVAAGNLDGQFGEELVFGSAQNEGPAIARFDFLNGWTTTQLALPPATPHQAPARELIRLGDLDGDGDLDLVHKLRVLWNGGAAGWSVGPDFAALVPATVADLKVFDYDGDGDGDVLLCRDCVPTLLRNDRIGFVDATLGTIPTTELFGGVLAASVGDVDTDGDLDVLLTRGAWSNLLRNDNGVFTRIANVGLAGVLVDGDHDGRPDLFDGVEFHANLFTHLYGALHATPGGDWPLQLRTWRFGAPAGFAFLAIGTRIFAFPVSVPGLGDVFVDPQAAFVLPLVLTQGQADHMLVVPRSASMLGVELAAQALVVDAQRVVLSGAVLDIVR
ncbi:MAG: VCBS repeat-containing protein [Planctomycetes bacterium]|nr:VCBS repeat-containing protein [Planctomycetota bacterium]